jgi:phenolic acid decarboxylase
MKGEQADWFEVRDITGRVVAGGNWMPGRQTLSVSDWTSGVYIFSWGDATNKNSIAFTKR